MMSILNFDYEDPSALIDEVNDMMPMMDAVIADLGLSDETAVQAVREGISPHIALGLSDDHLDAIFMTGLKSMQAGDVAQAQTVFFKLATLKAIDYRFWYALGTTFQVQDRFAEAGRIYMVSLSLRATDVDGYLRLGECLLASDEMQEALECFQTAWALCDDGHGTDAQRDAAERLVTHMDERMQTALADAVPLSSKGN
ncbi:hypothetical protein [Yoonia sp. BS5-3]|uniref:Tetratricopeptide repeat protein n=1 Tax=Yoonia phaeophyticola TaxID=3137369 RepID=A0ABZ2V4U8_9RHOB